MSQIAILILLGGTYHNSHSFFSGVNHEGTVETCSEIDDAKMFIGISRAKAVMESLEDKNPDNTYFMVVV